MRRIWKNNSDNSSQLITIFADFANWDCFVKYQKPLRDVEHALALFVPVRSLFAPAPRPVSYNCYQMICAYPFGLLSFEYGLCS
jgi:hypothetical protein